MIRKINAWEWQDTGEHRVHEFTLDGDRIIDIKKLPDIEKINEQIKSDLQVDV